MNIYKETINAGFTWKHQLGSWFSLSLIFKMQWSYMDMTNGDHKTLQNKPCLFVVLIPLFNQWKGQILLKKKVKIYSWFPKGSQWKSMQTILFSFTCKSKQLTHNQTFVFNYGKCLFRWGAESYNHVYPIELRNATKLNWVFFQLFYRGLCISKSFS